jgi:dTDP-4-dehydrorhamnose 3,5-epimerase
MIEGVSIRSIDVQADHRGTFAEVFSDRWNLPIEPRQWSLVRSSAGSLRGMHFHVRHDEYLMPVSGRCFVGLHDLRPHSATTGRSMLIEVDGADPKCVVFPRGVVHGWYFPVDTLHLQAVSEPYSDYNGDDNFGCHYADPELGLSWPGEPTLISRDAREFPSLATLRAQAEALWNR